MNFLTELKFAGNEIWRFFALFVVILLSFAVGRVGRLLLDKRGQRLKESDRLKPLGLVFISLSKPIVFITLLIGLRIGFVFLDMSNQVQNLVDTVIRVLSAVTIGYAVYSLVSMIDYYLGQYTSKSKNKIDDMLAPLIRKSLKLTVIVIVGVFVAESLAGKPITTLVASLGVGGLAVAFAAQETIKNFFGSLVIMADKPFTLGERVEIDGYDGMVEEVGFRSTKIRTFDGHLVTVPNSDVANKFVRNIGKRPFIRRVANITITYDTPPEKVERAVEIIKEILGTHEGMHPDFPPRVFFNEFNDASLNLLMIYWYHPPDYFQLLAFSEKVNMEILKRFNKEGIDFAFPTQTIYLANDDKRQLAIKLLRDDPDKSSS